VFSLGLKKWNTIGFVSSVQSKIWNLIDNIGTKRVGPLIFTLIVLVLWDALNINNFYFILFYFLILLFFFFFLKSDEEACDNEVT